MTKSSSNKKSNKNKIKGIIFIVLGVFCFIVNFMVQSKDLNLSGGIFIMVLGIALIVEGFRIKNGKKSILFNPDVYGL